MDATNETTTMTDDDSLAAEILRQQFAILKQKVAEEGQWNTVSRRFGLCYIVLGILAIIVNIIIFISIILRRRKTFSQVFYIIILNFTIIDTIKGISSILFALKHITSNMSMESTSWQVIVDQYSGVLMRFTNLTTIMNVLLITMNEFLFICYPLRYSTIVTRKRVLMAILFSWLLSAFLTILNMLTSVRHRSIMIDTDCELGEMKSCIRLQENGSLVHFFVFHLSLVAFCLICLAITAGCYVILFRLISKLMKKDAKYQAELDFLKKEEKSAQTKSIARRRKYVLMIGSVIVVYSIYLLTYAVIQAIHLINIKSRNPSNFMIILKFICYLFISTHSLLQPFCFMRMKEFRMILKRTMCGCIKRDNQYLTDFRRSSFKPTEI